MPKGVRSERPYGSPLLGKTVEESLREYREALKLLEAIQDISQVVSSDPITKSLLKVIHRDVTRALKLLGEPE